MSAQNTTIVSDGKTADLPRTAFRPVRRIFHHAAATGGAEGMGGTADNLAGRVDATDGGGVAKIGEGEGDLSVAGNERGEQQSDAEKQEGAADGVSPLIAMSVVQAIGILHHMTELGHPVAVSGYLSQRTLQTAD